MIMRTFSFELERWERHSATAYVDIEAETKEEAVRLFHNSMAGGEPTFELIDNTETYFDGALTDWKITWCNQ